MSRQNSFVRTDMLRTELQIMSRKLPPKPTNLRISPPSWGKSPLSQIDPQMRAKIGEFLSLLAARMIRSKSANSFWVGFPFRSLTLELIKAISQMSHMCTKLKTPISSSRYSAAPRTELILPAYRPLAFV